MTDTRAAGSRATRARILRLARDFTLLPMLASSPLFGSTQKADAADSVALTSLRVAASPADDVTSVLYAQQAGLFARAGIDLQLQRASSTAGLPAALEGGTYDIAKTSLMSLLAAHERGFDFKVVAPAAIYDDAGASRVGGYIVSKDAAASGRDFNGKTVSAIDLHGMSQLALYAWVDKNGGDSSTLQFIELPMAAALAAVEQRRVFAAACANPPLAAALATGKVRLVPAYGAIATRFLFSMWFTTSAWVAAHPDLIERFQRVVAQAAQYTNAHPRETAPILAAASSTPLATIESMPRVQNGTRVSVDQVQPVIDAAAKYKLISKPFQAADIIAGPAGQSR